MDQIKSLRVFCKVCETGGFAAAARSLDLSPAAVTRLVMDLEDRLGTRLLNRTTRSVRLTEAGDLYLDKVSRTLRLLDEADAEVAAMSGQPRGQLRVVAPPLLMQHQLLDLLPSFREKYPDVSVHLSSATGLRAPDPNADLTFLLMGDSPRSSDFVARKMAMSTTVLCASPDYVARFGLPSHPATLDEHDCFMAPHLDLPRELVLVRSDASATSTFLFRPRAGRLVSSSPEVLVRAALSGMGLLGEASYALQRHFARGELLRLLPSWHIGSSSVYATMLSRRHMPQRIGLFLDHVAQHWGDAQKDPWLATSCAAVPLPTDFNRNLLARC